MLWYWAVVLCIIQVLYLVLGGLIFHYLEGQHEMESRNLTLLFQEEFLSNYSCLDRDGLNQLIEAIEFANQQGITVSSTGEQDSINWDLTRAILFCVTVVTTIGYGNLSPSTDGGRLFCMFYALGGIPIMLILLAYMGSKISKLNKLLADKINLCTNKKLDSVMDTFVVAILGLIFMLLIPSALFYVVEGWPYLDSIYFVVITLSTVGFGDFVTGTNMAYSSVYATLVAVWTIVGLAWFAGVISTIQTSVERTVHKTEELRADGDKESINPEADVNVIQVEGDITRRNIFLTPTVRTETLRPEEETVCVRL